VQQVTSLRRTLSESLDTNTPKATRFGSRTHKQEEEDFEILQMCWGFIDIPVVSMATHTILPKVAVNKAIEIPGPDEGPLRGMNISARILSGAKLPVDFSHLRPSKKSLRKSIVSPEKQPKIPLILHFHGGGFISGGSSSHENYLRPWTLQLGVPILSVDYRLAPKYKYPIQLEECFYVYKWLLTTSDLGFQVSKIFLVGDSAGGNLVATVTVKAINEGLRVPDGILLSYPVVDLCDTLKPSRLLFSGDPLLNYPSVKLCGGAYIPRNANRKDPSLSPTYASNSVLSQFPKTVILVSEYDPFLDEGVEFGEKLKSSGVSVTIRAYPLPHGCLSFLELLPECNVPLKDSIDELRGLDVNKLD